MHSSMIKEFWKERALKMAILDGIAFFIMFGFGESYIGAFGVFMNATSLQIGLIGSLPLLIGALSQLVSVMLMEGNISRRKLIVRTVICQALVWLLIAALPWVLGVGYGPSWILLLLVIAYFVSGHMAVPVWTSLMGDIVPEKQRGAYFGYRNRLAGIFLISSLVAGGLLLHQAHEYDLTMLAFSAMFCLACIARLCSGYLLTQHSNPEYLWNPDDKFTFWQFIRRVKHSNFARFVFFYGFFNFAMFIVGPYFVPYMLRDLKLTYLEFMLVSTVGVGSTFVLMLFWGKFGDRYGNKQVLEICSIGLTFVPALWILAPNAAYLVGVQIIAGFFGAGFQMAQVNFLLDAVSPGKRGRCTAYMWVINSTCIVLGSLVGNWLLTGFADFQWFAEHLAYPFHGLLFVSSFFRILTVIVFLPKFTEVKAVENWKSRHKDRVFGISRVQPIAGAGVDLAVGIFRNRLSRRKKDTNPDFRQSALEESTDAEESTKDIVGK